MTPKLPYRNFTRALKRFSRKVGKRREGLTALASLFLVILGGVQILHTSHANGGGEKSRRGCITSELRAQKSPLLPWGAQGTQPNSPILPDYLSASSSTGAGSGDQSLRRTAVSARPDHNCQYDSASCQLAGDLVNAHKRFQFRLLGQKPSGVS